MSQTPGSAEPPKGRRTEWVTREYDEDGELISETITVKTVVTPKADAQPDPGGYL